MIEENIREAAELKNKKESIERKLKNFKNSKMLYIDTDNSRDRVIVSKEPNPIETITHDEEVLQTIKTAIIKMLEEDLSKINESLRLLL